MIATALLRCAHQSMLTSDLGLGSTGQGQVVERDGQSSVEWLIKCAYIQSRSIRSCSCSMAGL
jgi:hypothetical protein